MSIVTWTAPNGEVITCSDDTRDVYVWANEDTVNTVDGIVAGPWEFENGWVPDNVADAGELYRMWASHGRPGDLRDVA